MLTWASQWARTVSPYYGIVVLMTTMAFILSLWYTSRVRHQITKHETQLGTNETQNEATIDELKGAELDAIQSRIKIAKQQAIIDHLSANMTEEQLIEEKEVEKAQLTAIFNLLKEQKDKFQVSDMEELEQQLSLYR